jgi:hypothetical protein
VTADWCGFEADGFGDGPFCHYDAVRHLAWACTERQWGWLRAAVPGLPGRRVDSGPLVGDLALALLGFPLLWKLHLADLTRRVWDYRASMWITRLVAGLYIVGESSRQKSR